MIQLDRQGNVFILRMQAGENRFNGPFLDALHGALDEVEASSGDAALVTTGEGKFYSNGLDLAWFGGEGSGQVMETLAKVDPRLVSVVEMRYFAGLSDAEIASALGLSDRTVRRDWDRARLLLAEMLGK